MPINALLKKGLAISIAQSAQPFMKSNRQAYRTKRLTVAKKQHDEYQATYRKFLCTHAKPAFDAMQGLRKGAHEVAWGTVVTVLAAKLITLFQANQTPGIHNK